MAGVARAGTEGQVVLLSVPGNNYGGPGAASPSCEEEQRSFFFLSTTDHDLDTSTEINESHTVVARRVLEEIRVKTISVL